MVKLSDHLDMIIAVDWDVKHQTKQTNNLKRAAFSAKIMIYNHATSNLAIYSHETSQDKLPEA